MPGVVGWAGPPSDDGSLDDGAIPTFTGDIFASLMVSSAGLPTPFSYTSVPAPYADTAGCMAFTSAGVTAHPAAHSCLCTSCFTLMQQCDALPGCQAIWKCSADSGCSNSMTCYLNPGAPCQTVIDQWGTGGVSTALEQMLGVCGAAASPACPVQ
jgi:hypothetical protein